VIKILHKCPVNESIIFGLILSCGRFSSLSESSVSLEDSILFWKSNCLLNPNIIDSLTGHLCNILITFARKTLGSNSGKNHKEKQFLSKPWFDLDCKFARKSYRKIKRRFKSRKTDLSHSELRDAEKKYI
jgi:hypothetical protein